MAKTNKSLDLALDALGSPIRRQMLRLLAAQEFTVGQLAERFPVSRPAVSKHLRLLESAGMVKRETRGNCNYCKLDARGFDVARRWLDEFWQDALGRFKLLAENTTERERPVTQTPTKRAKAPTKHAKAPSKIGKATTKRTKSPAKRTKATTKRTKSPTKRTKVARRQSRG